MNPFFIAVSQPSGIRCFWHHGPGLCVRASAIPDCILRPAPHTKHVLPSVQVMVPLNNPCNSHQQQRQVRRPPARQMPATCRTIPKPRWTLSHHEQRSDSQVTVGCPPPLCYPISHPRLLGSRSQPCSGPKAVPKPSALDLTSSVPSEWLRETGQADVPATAALGARKLQYTDPRCNLCLRPSLESHALPKNISSTGH